MIPTWTIWLDGAAYSGETAQQEHAGPAAVEVRKSTRAMPTGN